jgi:hypothetical protein
VQKSDFYDYIMPFVPGVETPMVNFAIMRAVQIAAEQSGVLREAIDVPVLPAVSTYPLIPTDPTLEVSSVFLVRWFVDGTNIRIYPITDNVAEWMTTLPPSNPTAWQFILPNQITLSPVPNEAGFVRVQALLKPIFTIPGDVSDVWRDHMPMIANGALALLYAAPGKPWSSDKAAAQAYQSFAKSVLALRVSTRSGGMPNNATMTGVSMFGGSQMGVGR